MMRRNRCMGPKTFPSVMDDAVPWRVGAVVLAVALLVNLLTGNTLWRNYTLVGIAVFLVLHHLHHRGSWHIPPRTALAMAIVGALHFLGGSLAGVHRVFGVNGLYYILPWWDNAAHALGGAAVWLLADAVLRQHLGGLQRRVVTSVAAVALAVLAGVVVELYEFAGFLLFGTVDQGFYTNTMLDLYYDLLGAVAAAVAAHRWDAWWGPEAEEGPGAEAAQTF